MTYSRNEILDIMKNERYPLSSKYDPDWILQNAMGSHSLWLQESLTQEMNLKPGMRALDLGCGKAISSIFLAKEFGLKVCATDLWINSAENWERISESGMEDMIFPIHADAHELPFADGYFDVLMSVNSLFFYVADGEFLREKILRYVKPGGEIGIIVPGFYQEYTDGIPEDLKPHWSDQLDKWYTLDWWVNCFTASETVDILIADTLPDNEGNMIYKKSAMIFNAHEEPFNVIAGDNITFIRIIAKRKGR
ncbi:MAG: methyltransferase domain-containing protein [Ruminiclostridium sp.]|nr:methyltransferase domain-containing protein [Ruminiclostridium sp.]